MVDCPHCVASITEPLARSNTGRPQFTDLPSLCAYSESSLTNLIGSGLDLLCLQSHSEHVEPESHWTWPEVVILGADQKERGLCSGDEKGLLAAVSGNEPAFTLPSWKGIERGRIRESG